MVTGPLTPADVAALAAGDEDSFTEFKSSDTSPKTLAKELCAFLNTQGGRVLIGVEDDHTIVGLGAWDEEKVMNVARTLLDPPALPTWQRVALGGVEVGVATVAMGREKPYAVGGGEGKNYYIRAGSTSRESSREELIRLTQASGAVAPDLRPVIGASATDLDAAAVQEPFAGRRTIVWSELSDGARLQLLTRAEILHSETGTPTVGGLLCFGSDPQQRLPHALVRCVAYPTATVTKQILDQADATGRLDDQVRRAADFVQRNLRRGSDIEGLERTERLRPSLESVREVVANAVAHRDYGVTGPVQLRIFPDRLQVVSPGGLPNGVTPEAMRVGVSVHRNPFLVEFLRIRRIIDAYGRGIVLLVEEAARLALPEPSIKAPDGFVEVVVFWEA
jgi:ATP-dependent DNA helicase RecG